MKGQIAVFIDLLQYPAAIQTHVILLNPPFERKLCRSYVARKMEGHFAVFTVVPNI
jgi:hypothetical protein